MKKKYIYEAEVLENPEIAPHMRKMVIGSREAAEEAQPGQFINIYPKADRLILPRPISICDADPARGSLTIVYDVIGAGTRELSEMVRGDLIRISSPLGNGFRMPAAPGNPVLLISGGVGTAPMVFLAKRLREQGSRITAVTGFRKDAILTEELRQEDCRVLVTTELPSEHAFVGNVVDCMEVNQLDIDETWTCYACGPRPMLEAVARFLENISGRTELQVSLEARMGCGYGACVGCAVDIRESSPDKAEEIITRKKVCKDGPVFDGKAVVW